MNRDSFITIWGSMAAFAREIGEGETTVRNWFVRGSIPAKHDEKIMLAAARNGRSITPIELHQLRRSLAREHRGAAA